MKKKFGFLLTIGGLGLSGAFGGSLLFLVWTWLFEPEMFGDGQYGMAFMLTTPLGWFAGSVIGLVWVLANKNTVRPQRPFLMGIVLVIGGTIVIPIPGTVFMAMFCAFIGLIIERVNR